MKTALLVVFRVRRLDLVIFDVLLSLFIHFPVGTETEEEEGDDD